MTAKPKFFFQIAVALPVKTEYAYSIPEHLASNADVGFRVLVPFRKRKVTGYILEKCRGNHDKKLKDILDLQDAEPLFPKSMSPFFRWMADYYIYPIGLLIQSALPGGLNISHFKSGRLTDKGLKVLNSFSQNSDEKKYLAWIQKNPGKRLPAPLDTAISLEKRGCLVIEERVKKRRAGPLIKKFIKPKEGLDIESFLETRAQSFRARNEFDFLETVFESKGILLSELTSKFKNAPYLVDKWLKQDILEEYKAPVFRSPAGKTMFPSTVPEKLYDQQEKVLDVICRRLKKKTFSTCLLYGVTGSGKTEVYYRAIMHAVKLGMQTILMMPEIALAFYMEGLFRSRFDNKIAIFHSGLTEGERYDEWLRMARGEVDLCIGARSALFAPFKKLGLIIVDEEHDFTYKQGNYLRYQARDAAVARGKIEKALVILGSGTPSIQSYHNSGTGRYKLLSMPIRVENRPFPNIKIVDMKTVPERKGQEDIISPVLQKALKHNLEKGKQSILFLNRRGFDRLYLCRTCGRTIRCLNCDLALTYHLYNNLLVCHYCGFELELRSECPSCGSKGMKALGFGTEKLEKKLCEIFPEARIARMDRDSARRKGYTWQILKKFGKQEIDILVGTQMITKGYDFPNVTLVGVIAADFSLGFPDFRAAERTFQILSQVAGRAGRGDQESDVIIQTFNPAHYSITTARDYNYELFFQKEKELREQLGYPPFSFLACLNLQGNNKGVTVEMAHRLGQGIREVLKKWPKRGGDILILGPAEAPMAKLKGKYRWQILIKCKRTELLHYFLKEVERYSTKLLRASGVSMIIDMDPYQML